MKKIILAGGSGFLGHVLGAHFQQSGHEIIVLARTPKASTNGVSQIGWDARTIGDWTRELEDAAAVINLVGRSVNCRYNKSNQRVILESRINATQVIGEAIAKCSTPPPVWLNASTATIYKHTFGQAWDESGQIGSDPEAKDEFSVEVATQWERIFNEVPTPGTRKVAMRAAMVLGGGGNSVFPVLRRLTCLGLGGKMGNGKQFASWIHEKDFCRAVEWLLTHGELGGPVNFASPNPVTNAEMMKIFREVFAVPIGLPATKWMLEIGTFLLRTETELVIKSRRVIPGRLLASGFQFQFPHLRQAVKDLKNV